MRHRPYPKIPTGMDSNGHAGGAWVATEKIHGANLVVASDGNTVRVGKRKAWLADQDPFFGWQRLRSQLQLAVRGMFAELSGCDELHVFGELYGGHYPHPEVAPVAAQSAVQTGICYAPAIHWSVFDAMLVRGDKLSFLGYDELTSLAARHGLKSPPLLARGGLQQLRQLAPKYQSRVPQQHQLPELANNYAEGYVLKPCSAQSATERPVIKCKIPEFSEARFDESQAFEGNMYITMEQLIEVAVSLMNMPRIDSARSKVGDIRSAVVEEALLDVWVDLEDLLPQRMQQLHPGEDSQLREQLEQRAQRLLETQHSSR